MSPCISVSLAAQQAAPPVQENPETRVKVWGQDKSTPVSGAPASTQPGFLCAVCICVRYCTNWRDVHRPAKSEKIVNYYRRQDEFLAFVLLLQAGFHSILVNHWPFKSFLELLFSLYM